MLEPKRSTRIGEALVHDKLIVQSELEDALSVQQQWGSKLGEVLIAQGRLNYLQFYQSLAAQYGVDFADLLHEPCDELLLEASEREFYLKHQVIPWKREGKTIVLATSHITPDIEKWAQEKFSSYDYAITTPFDILSMVQQHFAEEDDEEARELLWQHDPKKSAKSMLMLKRHSGFVLISLLMIITAMVFMHGLMQAVFIAINAFYTFTLFSKAIFFGSGIYSVRTPKASKAQEELMIPPDHALPVYTLLVPLFKEKQATIELLTSAIRALDYPKSKLDVKLIIEQDDVATLQHIKALRCERFFEIISVPYSLPRTKPKACNYALRFARGEYVTIYDAEDKPDPMQLKKVLHVFGQSGEEVACVQARLNYYNREENVLTRMFSLEYGSWFNFMLPGLQRLRIPIPLGGTSNHFRTAILRKFLAWDPYNVTEDADLGIRLAQYGHSTRIVDSTTMEESPITLRAWMKQRSRWIKGYIQTLIVHLRQPRDLMGSYGLHGLMGFLFFVGAPALVFLTIPFVIILSALAAFGGFGLPEWFVYLAALNFAFGFLLHWLIALTVMYSLRWPKMLAYSLIFPFYWVLHSIASFKAVWQLFTRPHYWEKTEHGVSKITPPLSNA